MSKTFTALMAIVIALVPMSVPSVAMAGPYVGFGIGGTRTESSLQELNLVPSLPSDIAVIGSDPDFSSTDVSLEFTVGWMFNKHFFVEVGYVDFGEARANFELPLSPPGCEDDLTPPSPGLPPTLGCQSREWTATMSTTGIKAFAIGSVPLGETVDAYLKLGAISWKADYEGFENNVGFIPGPPIGERNPSVSYDGDGTDLAAGMGLNLKTDSPFSVRAELTYYDIDTTDLVWIAQLMGIYTF